MLCVWWALRYFTKGDTGENEPRGIDASETAEPLEATADSGNTPSVQREEASQGTVEKAKREGSKKGLRDWLISTLEKLVNFMKDSKRRDSSA